MTPAVSAVQFDAERLGSTACRMLLDVMAGKDIPLRQVQGYQVILRESTKCYNLHKSVKKDSLRNKKLRKTVPNGRKTRNFTGKNLQKIIQNTVKYVH